MTDLPRPLSWPAAQRSGAVVVQHAAWEEARNAVLDLAAEGPVTVFLTGEPGSGKTWLLRELAASLGEHGFPTVALLRGDLPIPLGDGVAVLVDEASYMPDGTRAELASQDRGVVVLADIEPFAPSADDGPVPVQIHLRLLTDAEIDPFVTEWLHQAGLSSAILDSDAMSRLADHSGGAVRLIAQLLTAATALARADGGLHLTATLIDQVAAFRLGASMPDAARTSAPHSVAPPIPAPPAAAIVHLVPPAAPRPLPAIPASDPVIVVPTVTKPSRRKAYRRAVVGTALAASVVAAIAVSGSRPDAPSAPTLSQLPLQSAQIALPDTAASASPIVTAERATPEPTAPAPVAPNAAAALDAAPDLPPLQAASIPAPVAVADAPPPPATRLPTPSLATAPAQAAAARTVAPATAAPAPITVAAIPPPTLLPVISSGVVAPIPAVLRPATSGLILVAQRGDTLERLYADIYRDRHAPPFAAVLAVNPAPFKPGAVVVFPEPIGGWSRPQR